MKRRHFFSELSAGLACMTAPMLDAYTEEMNNALAEAREELPVNPEVMGYPTIQAAIDAAEEGSTIIVDDGVYHGGFEFKGKAITVTSRNGPENCIIDLDSGNPILFADNETSETVLDGFTIVNGMLISFLIVCRSSSPTISNNILTNSKGGAVWGKGTSSPIIRNNIVGFLTELDLGVIRVYGSPGIAGNIIFKNKSMLCTGIHIVGGYANIINNTIVGSQLEGPHRPDWNKYIDVAAVMGTSCSLEITNTILRDNGYDYDIKTGPTGEWEQGYLKANILLNKSTAKISYCDIDCVMDDIRMSESSLEWGEGNFDADPLFVDVGGYDFHLREASPCKNAGQNGFDIGAYTNEDIIITGIGTNRPSHLTLDTFPNPFNQTTTIVYTLPQPSNIRLAVYTVNGQCVHTLLEGFHPAGRHTIVWNAVDMPSGVYICSLEAGGHVTTRKMMLLK